MSIPCRGATVRGVRYEDRPRRPASPAQPAASYSWTAARWAAVSPGSACHLPALVLGQHEIAVLVLVHPDDLGHSGVIEPARLGQGRLQHGELPAVTSIPSQMCWVNQPAVPMGH